MSTKKLRHTIYQNLLDLATSDGITASGKDDVYGCIFGRDSAITILKILKTTENSGSLTSFQRNELLTICKRALITLTTLQGTKTNLESGEEPGKFIHEYRPDNYERLLKLEKPWYIYPDGIMRNYDSLDSTPLALIALYKYWKQTRDNEFLLTVLPSIERGLNWIITYGDKDKDFLLEYELSPLRTHGGLVVQSWTDSTESMLTENGEFPLYPIAPVEVQGYAWLALKQWGRFYKENDGLYGNTEKFARKLDKFAISMKQKFNEVFLFEDQDTFFPSQALDGHKNQIQTITGNALLLLWATDDGTENKECILENKYIPDIVARSFEDDMFDTDAGIRTMASSATTYNPNQDSYHNGSFWPKLNGMSHEGLNTWGYKEKAELLKNATLKPIHYFGTAIELYTKGEKGTYLPFKGSDGQESCRNQAWSAAVTLDLLSL